MSSIGISAVQALFTSNTQIVHASLAAHVTPWMYAMHALHGYAGRAGEAALNAAVTAQAAMIAYLDDFHLMFVMTLVSIPLLLFVPGTAVAAIEPKYAIYLWLAAFSGLWVRRLLRSRDEAKG